MTLDEIRGAIRIEDGALTVTPDTLGSDDVTRVLAEYFPARTLVLSPARIASAPDDPYVEVRGGATVLGVPTRDIVVRFYPEGGAAQLDLGAELPAGWRLDHSFPSLAGSDLAGLALDAPRVDLTSRPGTDASGAMVLRAGYGAPAAWEALLWFASPAEESTLSGPLRIDGGEPAAALAVSPEIRASLGGYLDLSLRLEHRALPYPLPRAPEKRGVTATSRLAGAVSFPRGGEQVEVPLAATFGGQPGVLKLEMDTAEAFEVGLADLGAWLNGVDLASDGLPELYRPLSGLTLSDVSFAVGLRTRTLEYVTLSVESTAPWTVIERVVVLERIRLHFMVMRPAEAGQVSATIAARLTMGGVELDVYAELPDFRIEGGLAEGSAIDLSPLVEAHLGGAHGMPATLRIGRLWFRAWPSGSAYSFSIEVEGDWELLTGLALTGLAASITYDAAAGEPEVGVHVQALFEVGDVAVNVSATKGGGEAVGWRFEGSTGAGQEIPIGRLAADLARLFGVDAAVPAAVSSAVIENLHVSFDTGTKAFSFSGETKLELDPDHLLDLVVTIDVQPSGTGYRKTFRGVLTLGGLELGLAFDQDTAAARFVASYHDLAGGTVNLGSLVAEITSERELVELAGRLEIALQDALFAYDRPPAPAPSAFVFGADIGGGVSLSGLPLVGRAFPASQTLRVTFRPLIASRELAQAEVAAVRALVPAGGFALPDRALPRGLSLATTLQVGDTPIDLSLPVGIGEGSGALTDQSPDPSRPATPAPAGSTPAPDGVSWLPLQRSFGPVQLQRVGVRYQGGDLWFYLDAALSAAGLTLALDGLGAGITLAELNAGEFRPKFSLRGVGIDYSAGGVEVGGFLLHLPPEVTGGADEYDGMAVIRTPALGLAALGSYAELDGQRSLFLYAVLNYPIGGPAFFFVTGLAAGFGYNRALRMPAVDQVARFPLVAEAVQGGGASPPAGGAAQRTFLLEEIAKLREFVPIQAGEYFFALGIRFSSFKQIDSFALLAVSFGQHLEVDVLGLSTALIPSPDETGETVPPLAEVQLALRATFLPAEGFLGVLAQLTSASYLFSRDCHLTGGFAFYSWFSGEHAGDFVLTVGGYHPSYRVPAHYPAVPRLGFNWQVTRELSVKGEAYFALTAHALMAGARLQATWQRGSLKAWFDAGADFLVAWKPYHYEARVYVSMGVSYTYELFGTHHLTVDVGADLSLWGPPFSGVARIDISVVSFTIEFGAKRGDPKALDWTQFRTSFLPAESGAACGVSASGGLLRSVPGGDRGGVWIVNPKELVLTTNAVIPATRAELDGTAVTHLAFADDARMRPLPLTVEMVRDGGGSALPRAAAPPDIGIAPMKVRRGNAAATHGIRVTYAGGEDATDWFTFTSVLKKAPAGLWGDSFRPELNGASWIDGTLAGFELRPATPAAAGATHPIDRASLQYDTALAPTPLPPPDAYSFVEGAAQGEAHLRDRIAADDTVEARNALLASLGFDPARAVAALDASVAGDFLFAPRAGTLT